MVDTKLRDFKKELKKRIKGDVSFDEITLVTSQPSREIYQNRSEDCQAQ